MKLRLRIALLLTVLAAAIFFLSALAELRTVPEEIMKDPAWQAMARVKAEVLAVWQDPNSSGTKITLGFRFENSEDEELVNLKKIQFAGRDGIRPVDLKVNSFWYSEEGKFAIALLESKNAVKPSSLKYTLFSRSGDILYEGVLHNEICSFSDYKTLAVTEEGASLIFELNGCHYITAARWCSDTGVEEVEDGVVVSDTSSYTLAPLGRVKTEADLYPGVRTEEKLPGNVSISVCISDGMQAPDGRFEIQLKAKTFIPVRVYESEAFDEETFHLINREAIQLSQVILTDPDGNKAVLEY